ncbi:hypothetical protein N7492_003937 [Penicillium capsulatum]|uniref:Uncharacterized protein n=1 Tax=Penicillium capsulatum TaxID=69766 RepID=A0A9W9LXX4_9EURO|nr:hypothetical protein N7492_003937 [Penicillium capsulatum]KAJ6121485.1 hypothetical protein N7512_003950 [Penicillium capsulatum]
MNSPPKRRKTSETSRVAVGVPRSRGVSDDGRASGQSSFQSPTRSSLAKSHPDVLERALSRSPSRGPTIRRGQTEGPNDPGSKTMGLRDRKAFRPSLGGSSSPLKAPRPSGGTPLLSPSKRASGIQAFSKPPRRLSRRMTPADFTIGSPVRKQIQSPKPDLSNTPEDQLASELGSATKVASMGVAMDTGLDGGFGDDDSLEPDLPPTPTQLGLEKAPDRPRNMLSSSPTARHEKRLKIRAEDMLQGSPLKILKYQVPATEDGSDNGETADGVSVSVLEKRKSRRSLKAELQSLKNDLAELSQWTGKIESGANLEADTRGLQSFLQILAGESSHLYRPVPRRAPVSMSSLLSSLLPFSTKASHPARETSPLPTNPFGLKESSLSFPYLTVFAPLALRAHTSRTPVRQTNGLLETHTLTFTPPPPFPANLYNVSVVYETDPENQSLTSLSVPTGSDSKKRKVPETLRRWMDSRLANPLLKLDVASLCWGINRYWETCVARAQLWAQIEQKHGDSSLTRARKDTTTEPHSGVISTSELRRVIPHLERSTMVIKSSSTAPRVLLSNILTMDDWTGEPQLRPEVSVSVSGGGVASKKIDLEARKLFYSLLHEERTTTTHGVVGGVHADAILRATEGMLASLFGQS